MADAIYKQALDTVVTDIKALSLTGIDTAEVIVRKLPWDDKYIHRGISVGWTTPIRGQAEPTNERNFVGYPCLVTMVQGSANGSSEYMNNIATWHQKIFRKFNRQRITISGESNVNHVICIVEPGELTLPKQYVNSYDASQLVVVPWFLEPRG